MMNPSRRTLLQAGGAGIIAVNSLLPAQAAAVMSGSSFREGLVPRNIVLLRSDDADASAFAQAVRAAAQRNDAYPVVAEHILDRNAHRYDFGQISTIIEEATPVRLVALVDHRDATVLDVLLRRSRARQYFQGFHSIGNGFSRHRLGAGQTMAGLPAVFATRLAAGPGNFTVLDMYGSADAPSTKLGSGSGGGSWATELGMLLGMSAAGQRIASARTGDYRRGLCAGSGRSFVSMIADI